MIKVILLIDCASEFDRKLLRGMMRYSKENGPWLFYRMPSDLRLDKSREEWVVELAVKWGAQAIIGRWDEKRSDLLEHLDIPIVLQNNSSRSDVYSNLTGDYEGTGKMAAKYFRHKLFVDYAFYGVRDVIWSDERGKGFKDEVLSYGGRFYSYEEDPVGGDDREMLLTWLRSLPEHTALFCCDDAHALYVTETCMMAGISVPDEISVLGVDDDELLCAISDPTISSIQLDVEHGGYRACQLLHQQILDRSVGPFNVSVSPLGINERGSTSAYNIADKEVLKLVRHIENSYDRNVTLEDLLRIVPLSRRSVEMRFKKAMNMSIYQYLLSIRVNHFAFLLRTTDLPYMEAASRSGFQEISNVSRIFRRYKGCSPLEYRRKFCVI